MFVSEKIVFVELQKTGCTHIRDLLHEFVGGSLVGKHNQAGRRLFSDGRVFLGSVRDPWDWHVSLWAFGCQRKGTVFGNVTKEGIKFKGRGWRTNPYRAFHELLQSSPHTNAKQWQRTYRDADDPGAFRDWLRMMHDKAAPPDVEGYAQSPLHRIIGFMTYSYLKTFACKKGEWAGLNAIATPAQLLEYEKHHCFIDHFIRNEHLESDLIGALKSAGVEVPAGTESDVMSRPKTNATSRKRKLDYYYDAESEQLVARWERLIVEKFGYAAPSSASRLQ